jgi:tripartite-type tricarboxylate transporter receptor subunit TctC
MKNSKTSMAGRLARAMVVAGLAAVAWHAAPALAQDAGYPSKPIQIVSSQGVGGGVDALLRAIGSALGEKGVSVVIDSKPGANGLLATNACKTARPDGYTFCLVNTQYVLLPYLQTKPAYDPVKDFEPVTHIITASLALGINKHVPAKSFKELIDYSKAHPGLLNYVALGPANPVDIGVETLMKQHGVQWVPIPYKGAGDAALAFGANDVQITFITSINVASVTANGGGKVLFVTGDKHAPMLPGVPTLAETGMPNPAVGGIWFGLIAPPGTPKALRDKFAALVADTLKLPAVAQRAAENGYDTVGNTPEQFARFIVQEGASSAKALAGKPKL